MQVLQIMKQKIKNNKKYFLTRGNINNYKVLIDGRNFYGQPINDLIKQYDEDYLLDYVYSKDNYKLIAFDL